MPLRFYLAGREDARHLTCQEQRMNRMMQLIGIVAALVTAACGGTIGSGDEPTVHGTATVSGALSETITNVHTSASYVAGASTVNILVQGTNPTTGTNLSFSTTFTGTTPPTGTSTQSGTVLVAGTISASNFQKVWGMVKGDNPSNDAGTMSITITSIGNEISSGGTNAWLTVHGSMTAVLPANSSSTAAGTVNLSLTF
jgi:hypothetical protein